MFVLFSDTVHPKQTGSRSGVLEHGPKLKSGEWVMEAGGSQESGGPGFLVPRVGTDEQETLVEFLNFCVRG